MRGDGPGGEAQYRRGPLLGHQVAEGREEPPQFRELRQPFRGCACCSGGSTGSSIANSLIS